MNAAHHYYITIPSLPPPLLLQRTHYSSYWNMLDVEAQGRRNDQEKMYVQQYPIHKTGEITKGKNESKKTKCKQ